MSHHVFISLSTGSRVFSVLHNHLYFPCFNTKVLSVFVSVILPEKNKACCFYMQMTANLVTGLL